jgi:hypothetical protein
MLAQQAAASRIHRCIMIAAAVAFTIHASFELYFRNALLNRAQCRKCLQNPAILRASPYNESVGQCQQPQPSAAFKTWPACFNGCVKERKQKVSMFAL